MGDEPGGDEIGDCELEIEEIEEIDVEETCAICGNYSTPPECDNWDDELSRDKWAFCDLCDNWVHLFCSGKTNHDSIKDEPYYYCQSCLQTLGCKGM